MSREECKKCALGRASGEGAGLFCPFIDRQYQRGDVLYRAGEVADYVWYVKSGAVELTAADGTRAAARHKSEGSFVGLESLVRERYDATARVADDATLCGASSQGMAEWLGPSRERTCVLLQDLLGPPGAPASEPDDES